jgi:hypothetical protein
MDQLRGAVVVAHDRAGHDYVLPEQVDLISAHVAGVVWVTGLSGEVISRG